MMLYLAIQRLLDWMRSTDPEKVKAWGPILIGFVTVLSAFAVQFILIMWQRKQFERQLGTTVNQFNTQNTLAREQFDHQREVAKKQYQLSRSEEEREEIYRKLGTFYGPFKELRTQSKILYRKFAAKLREEAKQQGQRFRTLEHLCQGKHFIGQDAEILSEILRIGKEILILIETRSGVVDKVELQELLGMVATHTRILQLACDGKLTGPPDLFADLVFPRELDSAIESAILRLQDKLKELGGDETLVNVAGTVTEALNPTIKYYNDNVDVYARQTMFCPLPHLYEPFGEFLPASSRILDAGCGVGRDTRHFIEEGHIVISFDASIEMVKKCREYPHAYCIQRSFEEVNFKEEFDGVWANASLVHLEKPDATKTISRLATALKPGGIMFISLKEGQGTKQEDDGRFFQYYTEVETKDLYTADGRLSLIKLWKSASAIHNGSDQSVWLNILLKRITASGL